MNLMGNTVGRACPKCGEKLPAVRMPKNLRQLMWGGNTCANCGTEVDRRLRPVERK